MKKKNTQRITLFVIITFMILFASFSARAISQFSREAMQKDAEEHPQSQQNPFNHLFTAQNLWIELQRDLALSHEIYHPEVQKQIAWYMHRQKYIYKMAENAKPYLYYILQQAKKRHLPPELALLPMIESAYDPFAYSSAGAAGLWQIMPGTASGFGLKQNWWYDGRRDVIASTNAALDYLVYLDNFFNGNWILAIAAYDSGEGTVLNAIRKNVAAGKPTDFWSLPLPKETKAYIPRLLALAEIISHPNKYPVNLPFIPNQPYLAEVKVDSQIDLKMAAKLSGLTLKELLQLNPGYNRWATAPDGPNRIILPIEKVAEFQTNLEKLPKDQRVTWQQYTVTSGDTLSSISSKYHTSTDLIKKVNGLKSDVIHQQEVLFIPLSSKRLPSQVISSAKRYITEDQKKLPGPQKVTVIVKKGDTLNSIAKKYHVTTNAIQFWNGMKRHDVLKVNQKVILWVKSTSHIVNYPSTQTLDYIVKPGDSLTKIAAHNNTTVSQLKHDNHLHSNVIRVGQTLTITHKIVNEQGKPGKFTYTVQSGDTLSGIASHFHTTVSLIKDINQLKNNAIVKGQALTILTNVSELPKGHKAASKNGIKLAYIVQPNDSLSAIASRYNVSIDDLRHWNVALQDKKHVLQVNETLYLYL